MLYTFDPQSLEYLGAIETPLEQFDEVGEDGTCYTNTAMGMTFHGSTTPVPEWQEGHVFRWNYDSHNWDVVEDHRNTPYWLAGDTHDTPPHYMEELGPLPDGATVAQPEWTEDELFKMLRDVRDQKLKATDFYLSADYPIEADKLEKVKVYRQALRDITALDGAPWDGGGSLTPFPVLDLSDTVSDSTAAE